jgi:hypothetical protein
METQLDELTLEIGQIAAAGGAVEKIGFGLELHSTVVAALELGANNAVFIRGRGCGLRWDRGQPLTRLGPRRWVWTADPCEERIEFWLLLDDQVWARGKTSVLDPGCTIEIAPDFEWPEIPKVANKRIGAR